MALSWTDQPIAGLPNGSSKKPPALASYGGKLFLVWLDSNLLMNISSWQNATAGWTAPLVLDKTSPEEPALAEGAGELLLAWRANDLSESIYISSSTTGERWSPSQRLDWTSPKGPALAVKGLDAFLAWTSSDSSHQLFHAKWDGKYWTEARRIAPASPLAPALLSFNADVWLAGSSMTSSPDKLFFSKPNGGNPDYWDAPQALTSQSKHRPAFAGKRPYLYMAWPESTAKITIAMHDTGPTGGITWPTEDSLRRSHVAPALAAHNGEIHMVWIDPGGTDQIKHSWFS
jgi:hypothetical protein